MFKPPYFQFNGHLQTIVPSLFRKVNVKVNREKLELPDGDFLLLDWVLNNSKKCVIVTHGLEGDSTRHYVTGVLKKFTDNGYDGLAWNARSCGGEINRLPKFYHHGDATDLLHILKTVQERKQYESIVLVGFSMGGSLTLRVISEFADTIPFSVSHAVAVSVPLDLPTSVRELSKNGKRFYMKRFIKKLRVKITEKEKMFPNHDVLNTTNFDSIKDFESFDNRYTAPLHGYLNAEDFYSKASVKPFLSKIKVKTLIIQSKNDPFLTKECLDLGDAVSNKNLKLIVCPIGGHVGFAVRNDIETFVEKQAFAFSLNQ